MTSREEKIFMVFIATAAIMATVVLMLIISADIHDNAA